ncbi:helix-turn-helix domain-containing protein [Paenibacillus oenotherae]|uniref:Helix-turn-helix domain-containing protein n=1 Tax=Paenibacillus oenotherae TaxID=1435645 RepID=A0ABS7D417_9BACL|nr:helix-turn-helix transcriptional regulator [Paenibacillus oenotherae]MBW7474677.1 helix-turn-helix domain-containing protein [Paenibacillus oenotherae]
MIGKQLRELRKSRSMTQVQLATLLNTAKSTISQYENDINEPDLETLIRIADFFEVTLDELVGRELPYPTQRDRSSGFQLMESLTEEEAHYLQDSLSIYRKWIAAAKKQE